MKIETPRTDQISDGNTQIPGLFLNWEIRTRLERKIDEETAKKCKCICMIEDVMFENLYHTGRSCTNEHVCLGLRKIQLP